MNVPCQLSLPKQLVVEDQCVSELLFFCCWFIGGMGVWVIQIIEDSQS
jgi:hypothetical protein